MTVTGKLSQPWRNGEWSSRSTSCSSGKWTYPTRAQAKKHARLVRKTNGGLRPYVCAECGLWHVGHKPTVARLGVMSSGEWYAGRRTG